MQYLKDDVKQKIIKSALAQFKENGYRGASMRVIALNADIVSGNIYRYFKNKEDLFESVIEPVCKLMDKSMMMLQKKISENTVNYNSQGDFKIIKENTLKVLEMFSGHEIELLILLDKSEGTKYADTKGKVILAIDDILKKNHNKIYDDYIMYVLSYSFINGICLILSNNIDGEERLKKLIDTWINIIFCDLQKRI